MRMTHHMSMSAQQRADAAAGPELDASLRALQQASSSRRARFRNDVSQREGSDRGSGSRRHNESHCRATRAGAPRARARVTVTS